ncbi:WD40 repeat domain-containing serine/threonine protein kinase [Thermostaphylospora chromogena]|uniref:Serine/threonine protein kinase n=1 Tax=Thermostaphylospora chromogena TaxID=35622 RepID=A0A1H1E8I1_9ACTN|nr:Serine/threonine protein kinase [Thermostaphylospora chromogena]
MPSLTPLRSEDPARLGEYDLRGRLGEGGQGVVYLATAPSGQQVAVKWLRPELASDPVMVERFMREVAVAERVAPFCTAQVLGRGIQNNRPYIVSEYIEGPSLQKVVTESGPRTGSSLHRLAIGTATALAAIHQAGIVHRDFKPANVILASDGPRVIDFGIARALDATSTISSAPVGTPSYMAPEQILGHTVTSAADMFSWGSTMIFAASGNAPFGTDTLPAVINRVLNDEPDLSVLDGTLRELVAACLSKDPARRPPADQVIMRLLHHPVSSAGSAGAPAILQQAAAEAADRAPGPEPYGAGHPGRNAPGTPWAATPPPPPQPTKPLYGLPHHSPAQPQYAHAAPPPPGPRIAHQGPQPSSPPPIGQQPPYGHPAPPGYGGPPPGPPPGPPTAPQSGSGKGGLIAAVIGGVLAVALVATLAVVFLNTFSNSGATGSDDRLALSSPSASAPSPSASTPSPDTPSPTASPIATDDLKRTSLPGGTGLMTYEHPSDAIILTSYQIRDRQINEWVDYARSSLTGGYSKYPNNWESKVSPDGRYLASRGKRYTDDGYDSVTITDRETGSQTTIKTVKEPLIASVWVWSADSRRVLLAIERQVDGKWFTEGFVVATVGDTEAVVVENHDRAVRESYYGWSGDGEHVVAVAVENGVRSLKFYDLNGEEVNSIRGIGPVPTTMDFFSPSGKRFIADCDEGDGGSHCVWDVESATISTRFSSGCDKVLGWYDETHLYCWEVDGSDNRVIVVDFQGTDVRTLLTVPEGIEFSVTYTRNPNVVS